MKALNRLVAVAAFAALGSASAGAVEVRQVVEIKAAPADVWAKVGGWCAIKDWHPAIAACDASKTGYRTLTLKDGGKIVEKLTKTGKNSYSYAIMEGPLPVKNYTAFFAAKPDSLGTTDLTWIAKFDAKGKSDTEAAAVITGIFEAGLKNIKDNVNFDAKPAAAVAAATVAARDEARLKAREARAKKLEALKLKALEEAAKAKEEFAKLREQLLEKAKAAATAARAEYEKAKAAYEKAVTAPASAPADPAKK